ncbi:MAG: DUF1330 domain-containing protein [Syntrophomonadales bacterium]
MIQSNVDQFRLLKHNPNNEPVVMLNLLKFKPDGGRQTYIQYMIESNKYVEGVGGKMIFLGKPNELLYGNETWDLLMLVQYPSRAKFLEMANNPDYVKVHELREKAVEKAVLYATDQMGFRQFVSEA